MKTLICQNAQNPFSSLLQKTGFFLIISCLITTSMQAQLRYGIRAGLNFTNMSIKVADEVDKQVKPSFHFGGIIENRLNKKFALESGLLLSGKGTLMEHVESQPVGTITSVKTISPLYLEIPINALIKFEIGKSKLRLFAGPYIAFGIAGKYKEEYVSSGSVSGIPSNTTRDLKFGTNGDDDFKRTDFGLNFGAGVDIKKNFQIRAQFGLGLKNLDPQSRSEIKTFGASLSGIYMFGK